jgi:metal-responsive CopG/Arc/MetJ family transcriptional regulator
MKTAISIPDDVFQAAEDAARKLSLSRSELFTRAMREFLAARSNALTTEQLNQVYSKEDSSLDKVLERMQFASLEPEEW